jgi:hypothetical protein
MRRTDAAAARFGLDWANAQATDKAAIKKAIEEYDGAAKPA